jgi:SAM-dependent methyltransferase
MTSDGELSTGRDFRVYKAGMDASLAVKIEDLGPHVLPGTIIDKGCGTGKFLLYLSERLPGSRLFGMDLSRELLRTAESQPYPNANVTILKSDIADRYFPAGSVDTVIFSSVIHEIYSYSGYDRGRVRQALRNTRTELRPGGRVLIRDGVRPKGGMTWMRGDAETEARFRRFARDFKHRAGVTFTEQALQSRTWFLLSLHDANEFLSKKDYLENWAVEVNEEFGVFTLEEWHRELMALGFGLVVARSYVNPWILEHRYRGKVWLHEDTGGKPGPELPFPPTTCVLVGKAV